MVATMARKKKLSEETSLVRVSGDLGEMLSVIIAVTDRKIPEILDPLIRAEITRLYNETKPAFEKIQAVKNKFKGDA